MHEVDLDFARGPRGWCLQLLTFWTELWSVGAWTAIPAAVIAWSSCYFIGNFCYFTDESHQATDCNNNENSEMAEKKNWTGFTWFFPVMMIEQLKAKTEKCSSFTVRSDGGSFPHCYKNWHHFTMNCVGSFIGSVSCRVSAVSQFLFSG